MAPPDDTADGDADSRCKPGHPNGAISGSSRRLGADSSLADGPKNKEGGPALTLNNVAVRVWLPIKGMNEAPGRRFPAAVLAGAVPYMYQVARPGCGHGIRRSAAALSAFLTSILAMTGAGASAAMVTVVPRPYERALRNPLKGFTTLGTRADHEWATLVHHYIRWNEIEDREADGVDRIRAFCDAQWKDFPAKNVKVIPRVFLHWSGDEKYWPSDMTPDDYTSPRFKKRLLRLVERLGALWDGDPRVAFVEMGIFGKFGEHHSPSPTKEVQQLVGAAYSRAFPNKRVSVRHAWNEFSGFGFGEYWDSWAHYQQVWAHGRPLREVNARTGLWRTTYLGGETAYDWGLWRTQPGDNPTDSVTDPVHRDFIIDSIRWLHCTQLRWIDGYDAKDERARRGAEIIQRTLGYRFVLEEVRFTPRVDKDGRGLAVEFTVKNEGSAPFFYDWPVEAALLDPLTRRVAWKGTFKDVDIRTWLPGDEWTGPEWVDIDSWPGKAPKAHWADAPRKWGVPPKSYRASGRFEVAAPAGRYILALAVLDPAGSRPSLRFATANYLSGGRHPVGMVAVGMEGGGPLPEDFAFDHPGGDKTLGYTGP